MVGRALGAVVALSTVVAVTASGGSADARGGAGRGSEGLSPVVVPAACTMPRQRLHHGHTQKKYLPAEGWISTFAPPVRARLIGGHRDVVAEYQCTAGGVSWPSHVVIYGPTGRLLGSLDLGRSGLPQEHADVTSWHASGRSVTMSWLSYSGANFHRVRYHSRLRMRHHHLRLATDRIDFPGRGGVTVWRHSNDLNKLRQTSRSFRRFVTHRLDLIWTQSGSVAACAQAPLVEIGRYTRRFAQVTDEGQFVHHSPESCAEGGAGYIYAVRHGHWRAVLGTQEGYECRALRHFRVPRFIAGATCFNGSGQLVPYRP